MARQTQSWKLMLFSAGAFWLATIMYMWRLVSGEHTTATMMGAFLFPAAAALATLGALAMRRESQAAAFANVYEDEMRARAYDTLEFPGTYILAYRDLPAVFREHAHGASALDFGCGTGRSTRFLKKHGFGVVGVDISEQMVARARERDPGGDYRVVPEGDLSTCRGDAFDLVLSAFTFDNIASRGMKLTLLRQMRDLLGEGGCIVSVVSTPEIYVNEWASFSTKDYPENKYAGTGDTVRIVMLDVPDRRPVEDIVWEHEDYLSLYDEAGLEVLEERRPLATGDEPVDWVSETKIAPWAVYVLGRKD